MNNLRHTDNIKLKATFERELQHKAIIKKKKAIGLNIKKTVTMVISKKQQTPASNIKLKKNSQQRNDFKHPRANINKDGRVIHKIKIRYYTSKEDIH